MDVLLSKLGVRDIPHFDLRKDHVCLEGTRVGMREDICQPELRRAHFGLILNKSFETEVFPSGMGKTTSQVKAALVERDPWIIDSPFFS